MADSLFKYQVRISPRSRRVKFRVSPQRGLEVVVPSGFDAREVPEIVARNERWIHAAFERVASWRALHGHDTVWRLPERIDLPAVGLGWSVSNVPHGGSGRVSVRETAAGRLLVAGDGGDEAACRAALGRWLLREARRNLVPRLARTSREVAISYERVTVRRQKTRWGSCSRDGTISLNAKLLFLSSETVDYILIHELCHRVEMNHSPRFWRLVERHYPDFRRIDAQRREFWKAVPWWAE